jgi:PAS domain S-box-containing protein
MRYVNRALVDILGYDDASELEGKETSQVIHPRSEQALNARYAAMTSRSHPAPGVLECLKKDGTPILVEVTSMPSAFEGKPAVLAIVRDVTESSRAREAQERSEARFRALVNFCPVGIFEMSAEGTCVYANDQLAAMTGLTLPKILEEGWLSAVHPQDLPALQAKRAAAKTNGGLHHDFRFVASHGVVHVQARSAALTDGSQLTGYLGAVTDVTELRVAQAAVEQSLIQKDMLLKEIHHRVKNNLQVVASLLRLGRSYVKDPGALSVFNDSVARVHSIALIHERLYQTKNLDRIEMAGYLQGLVSEITRVNASSQRVGTQVLVEKLFFDLDRCVPIGLIVNELVANALKHAFPERTATAPVVIVALHEGTHEYALVVRDNGRGLNPEKRREGSLGLRIVESLAQQLGGKLRLEQEQGTAWHVTFSKRPEHA